jgi:uncharacterized protein Yka (UPF0111/DUF47 family)
MRNTLYNGSTPQEELEFAKTDLALGNQVDVEALIDAFEKMSIQKTEQLQDLRKQIKRLMKEIDSLEDEIDDLQKS